MLWWCVFFFFFYVNDYSAFLLLQIASCLHVMSLFYFNSYDFNGNEYTQDEFHIGASFRLHKQSLTLRGTAFSKQCALGRHLYTSPLTCANCLLPSDQSEASVPVEIWPWGWPSGFHFLFLSSSSCQYSVLYFSIFVLWTPSYTCGDLFCFYCAIFDLLFYLKECAVTGAAHLHGMHIALTWVAIL